MESIKELSYMVIPGVNKPEINRQLLQFLSPETIEWEICKLYTKKENTKTILGEVGIHGLLEILHTTTRKRPIPFIRFTCFWFIRVTHPLYSLQQVGQYFGNKDHSTVIHGVTQYENACKTDRKVFDDHLQLCSTFGVDNNIKPIFRI